MNHYLTLAETAELLRTTPNRLYKSISLKEMPASLFGRFKRKILFKKDALINWIEGGTA